MGLNLPQTPPARLLCSSFSKWALGQIEGMICGNRQLNDGNIVTGYNVIDPVLNLSDHRPVVIRCECVASHSLCLTNANSCHDSKRIKASYLRWDRADLAAYCELTRVHLTQIFSDLLKAEQYEIGTDMIDALYNSCLLYTSPSPRD